MKKLTIITISLLLLVNVTINSQENEDKKIHKLTVNEAVSLALENNISIKQSKLNLDLLERKKNSSWNSISPSFTLSGNYGGSDSGTVDQWKEGDQNSGTSWTTTGSVSLAFTPAIFTSIKAAKLAYEAGEMTYESLQRSIELSVRKSFYSLIYTKENITLQEAALERSFQTYNANKTKYDLGRLSELDLLTSQYSYESKKPSVDSLKNSYRNSVDSFKQVLGISLLDDIELIGTLEDFTDVVLNDELLTTELDELPSVKKVLASIDSAENALQATRITAWGPSISASTSATYSGNDKVDFKNLSVNYSLGVRIPLDGFLPWSNGALSIASQKTNLESLKLDLQNTKTTAAINIRNSYNAIIQAQAQLQNYERNVTLMQKTYDMTKNSYNAGSAALSTLQTAEDNLASAKYNLQAQRYSIISAVLDLESLLGLPYGTLFN